MRVFKHISFSEGISCTLAEFKKDFASHLKDLSEDEVKEAYKVATNGNNKTTANKSKESNADKSKA